MQYLEKAQDSSITAGTQMLASREQQEEFLMGEEAESVELKDHQQWETEAKLQSLTPDADGTGLGS